MPTVLRIGPYRFHFYFYFYSREGPLAAQAVAPPANIPASTQAFAA